MVENSITSGFGSDFLETKDLISSWLILLGEKWVKNHITDLEVEKKLSEYRLNINDLKPANSFERYQKENLLNLINVFHDNKKILSSLLVVLEVEIKTDYILEQVYGVTDEIYNLSN